MYLWVSGFLALLEMQVLRPCPCLSAQVPKRKKMLTLCGSTISGSSEITHCPNTRPETTNTTRAGQTCRDLENGILVEAELIPGLKHTRFQVEVVDFFLGHGDD